MWDLVKSIFAVLKYPFLKYSYTWNKVLRLLNLLHYYFLCECLDDIHKVKSFLSPSKLETFCWRYIYVSYAADLAAFGERLLKILVTVGILALCGPWIIIYPVLGNLTEKRNWHFKKILGNIRVENFPLNTLKGKICTQTLILEFNYKESVKPKAILLMFGMKSTRIHNTVVAERFIKVFFSLFNFDCNHHLYHLCSEDWKTFSHSEIQKTLAKSQVTLCPHFYLHNVC